MSHRVIPGNCRHMVVLCLSFLLLLFAAFEACAIEISAIGKIESLYRNRASMKIIEVLASSSPEVVIEPGNWISFDVPRVETKNSRRKSIQYGNVVEIHLVGAPATEYAIPASDTVDIENEDGEVVPAAIVWSTKKIERVKDPSKYMSDEEKAQKKRGRRRREKKQPEAPKIWTQEETVRGLVIHNAKGLYLKEPRLGKKDKGLQVVNGEWCEKLESFKGQKVVVYGVTHRVTVASGTMEVRNLMRVYPK